jgi:2-dehydropantoate 2-reductase
MKVLIYGAGAIGSHIAYCMHSAGHTVFLLARGEHYLKMKENGLQIKIMDNQNLKDQKTIKEGPSFFIIDSLDRLNSQDLDYIFITVKLSSYIPENMVNLQPYMGKDTAIIPPCTKLPFWWFYNFGGKYNDLDFNSDFSQYFSKENIIGMTMWLSAVIESPGQVSLRHTQRGYPLKEIHPKMKTHADKLRAVFESTCMSPIVENIRSEMLIKSINAFAFNMVALDKGYTNQQLKENEKSKDSIRAIMEEGDQILKVLNLPIIQDIESRITQTLSSSKHTMSMLHDYKNGKDIELPYIWSGFQDMANVLGIHMRYSQTIYDQVMTKCDNVSNNIKVS